MGRKRLLTILATVVAAVSLQAGPAAAQSLSLPGLGEINLGGSSDDCFEIGVDISLAELLKLDPSVCITEDGVEIEGGVEALEGKVRVDAGKATQPVQDATKKVAESVKRGSGSDRGEDAPTGGDDGTSSDRPSGAASDGGATGSGDGSGSTGGGGASDREDDGEVAASGRVEEPATARSAERQAQLGALMAIRNELAAGSPAERGIAGPVQTFGGLSSTDDLAAPQVADAGEVVPGVDERLTPEVAPSSEQPQEAVFASSTPMRDLAEAPLALQLLAAALVLGAAAVWTITAREYGTDRTTSV